ncbi:MAG: EpsG family protein [Oscillospiraceae bacterium]
MLTYFVMIAVTMVFAAMVTYYPETYQVKLDKSAKLITLRPKNILLFLSILPMVLVSGLRYMVGVDYNSYAWIFGAIVKTNEKTHVEAGYELLNKLVGYFTNDFVWLFVLTSAIIICFAAAAIKQNSSNIAYSIFLFISLGYFFYSMNSIRHFMALSIFFFAQKYMKKEEFWKFLMFVLIAASFHKIALIGIPIYFVFTRKFKMSYYVIISIFLVIFAVLNKQIMNIIFSFVYTSYKNSVYNVYDFSIFNVLLSGIATFFAIAYYKPLLQKNKANIIYINAAIFMLLFYLTCWWIPTPTRIGHFGTIFFILLFPEAIACEKNKKVRVFYYVALTLFALLFLIVMLNGAKDPSIGLLPYESVFSK